MILFIYLTKLNIKKLVKFRHAVDNVVDDVTNWLTQIYIAICTLTWLKSDVLVRSSRGCLHDNHLRFRPLSSTIRSHQNDCTRLHDCVSACGMRYLCVALLVQVLRRYCIRRIIKQRVSSSFCLCTGTSSHSKSHIISSYRDQISKRLHLHSHLHQFYQIRMIFVINKFRINKQSVYSSEISH